jgi:hypothetical protein
VPLGFGKKVVEQIVSLRKCYRCQPFPRSDDDTTNDQ